MQAFIAGYCEISLIKSASERRNHFEPETDGYYNRKANTLSANTIGMLVPMQSALNAWKIPTFADCFFNLCLFVLFENFGCKNLKHTIFEPLKLLFSLL